MVCDVLNDLHVNLYVKLPPLHLRTVSREAFVLETLNKDAQSRVCFIGCPLMLQTHKRGTRRLMTWFLDPSEVPRTENGDGNCTSLKTSQVRRCEANKAQITIRSVDSKTLKAPIGGLLVWVMLTICEERVSKFDL